MSFRKRNFPSASQAKRGALEPARAVEALRLVRGEAALAETRLSVEFLVEAPAGVIVRSRARGFSRGALKLQAIQSVAPTSTARPRSNHGNEHDRWLPRFLFAPGRGRANIRRRVGPDDIRGGSRDMISHAAKTLFFAAMIAGMGAAIPAYGASLPPSGSTAYSGYFACHQLDAVDMGESGSQTVAECVGITKNASDPKLFDNMSARCLEDGEARVGSYKFNGWCAQTDSDGDKLFTSYTGPESGPVAYIGGTGNSRISRSRELGPCTTRRPSRRVNSPSSWSIRSSGRRSEKIGVTVTAEQRLGRRPTIWGPTRAMAVIRHCERAPCPLAARSLKQVRHDLSGILVRVAL